MRVGLFCGGALSFIGNNYILGHDLESIMWHIE